MSGGIELQQTSAPPLPSRLKVLVADDAAVNRMLLRQILTKLGHQVLLAKDGGEAIELSRQHRIDLILMDVIMPDIDGLEAAKAIKSEQNDRFIPIIFVTALTDEASLIRAIEAGGDDFLSKPFIPSVLRAKIASMERIAALNHRLLEQRDRLSAHEEAMLHEQRVAAAMFETIISRSNEPAPNIEVHVSPKSVFNGDLALVKSAPGDRQLVLLGDFTGHGLPAAIGVIPVSQIFSAMASKGASVNEILGELSKRLTAILPVGVFFSAMLACFEQRTGIVEIANLGLPDVLIRRADGTVERYPSDQPPLGIPMAHRQIVTRRIALGAKDIMVACTDGVIESANDTGEMYGETRLIEALKGAATPVDTIKSAIGKMDEFCRSTARHDDITLLAMSGTHIVRPRLSQLEREQYRPWLMRVEANAAFLKKRDLVEAVMNHIEHLDGIEPHLTNVHLILAELISNALDYGVLDLSSKLKRSISTYAEYVELRQERLAELCSGHITVEIEHNRNPRGARLRMTVADSGRGFDLETSAPKLDDNVLPSGRGIQLVRSLCSALRYSGRGQTVEAIYEWETK